MSGILNTTGAVSGILGKSVLPVGVTGGSGLDESPRNGRNMIINGGMQVWQRATGTTTIVDGAYQTVDRFAVGETNDGAVTSEKHAMSLAEINTTGHSSAFQLDVTTADTSLSANQYAYFYQLIEAQNMQHLQWGTAAAKDVTLSFWVKSNKTGIYCAGLEKNDTTAYFIFDEYTINDANTWEYKTITFTPTAGSTTLITGAGGIMVNDNGVGVRVHFGLAWGTTFGSGTAQTWSSSADHYASTNQVNWMDSTSNNFYLTGVQLEAGSVATPFEHRSYGDELALCQRYYQESYPQGVPYGSNTVENIVYGWPSIATGAIIGGAQGTLAVSMRTAPTVVLYDKAGNTDRLTIYNNASTETSNIGVNAQYQDENRVAVRAYNAGAVYQISFHFTASAEL
jgi:hypothetical protein